MLIAQLCTMLNLILLKKNDVVEVLNPKGWLKNVWQKKRIGMVQFEYGDLVLKNGFY